MEKREASIGLLKLAFQNALSSIIMYDVTTSGFKRTVLQRRWIGVATVRLAMMGLLVVALGPKVVSAQSTMPSAPSGVAPRIDTAMIFEPSSPLLREPEAVAQEHPNSWGVSGSFTDYGFGAGLFLSRVLSADVSLGLTAELGTAQASREFDLITSDKVNRIYVVPLMLSAEYRLFRTTLSDNMRPYITAGAGPVAAVTTPYQMEFFQSLGSATSKFIPGGFVGVGSHFGTDPKSLFSASIRYFIIPNAGSIQSTATQYVTDLSSLSLTVSIGFQF